LNNDVKNFSESSTFANLHILLRAFLASKEILKVLYNENKQAQYSDGCLWRYVITVIAFVALRCECILPCCVRTNTAKDFSGFAA
jgi:hypothetical protein